MKRPLLLLLFLLLPATLALGDEFRPALLEITEKEPGSFAITWKTPLTKGRRLALEPILPDSLEQLGPTSTRQIGDSLIDQSRWRGDTETLVGTSIGIRGLRSTPIDVIIQLDLMDGSEHSAILRSTTPEWTIPPRSTPWTVAASYWKIGTIHILEGFDHLLFVLALIPQFIDPTQAVLPQFLVFGAILGLGGVAVNGSVGAFAGRIGARLLRDRANNIWEIAGRFGKR